MSESEVLRKLVVLTTSERDRDELLAELDGFDRDDDGQLVDADGRTVRYDGNGNAQAFDDKGRPVTDDDDDGSGDYESLRKDELVALADDRGIDSDGTKAEIAARLRADDEA